MAHRLAKSMRGVDRILMNGRWTGNFSNLAQVQPRHSEFRQFLLQSNVYFSNEPPKFQKPVGPKEGRSDCASKMKGKKTAKKNEMDKGPDNASTKSRIKSAPKAPNQVSKSGGNGGGGGGDRRKKGSGPCLDGEYAKGGLALFFLVSSVIVSTWRHTRRNIYEVIVWRKDFVDNNLQVVNQRWTQVQIAPGASVEVERTWTVDINRNHLCSNRNVAPVAETSETKAEPKNEALADVDKKKSQPERDFVVYFLIWLRARFSFFARRK